MSLKTTLLKESLNALRASRESDKAALRLRALRSALAAIQIVEKAPKAKLVDGEADDDDVVKVLRAQIKQRRESAKIFEEAGESTRAAIETEEADVLAEFVPQLLSTEATVNLVDALIAQEGLAGQGPRAIGKIMSKLPNTVDKGLASSIAKTRLS